MRKYFNTEGCCYPDEHYMVNLDSRLKKIKEMVDAGKYFTINRGRQYGKTTVLNSLEEYLSKDYIVISLDFQFMSYADFETESSFTAALIRELQEILSVKSDISEELISNLETICVNNDSGKMASLFKWINRWIKDSAKPVIMMIDEVDQATNNQVFLDFLAQLRGHYLKRKRYATFQSVILAGVHDIRNLRQKIRPDSEHKHNSPWNISAEFNVDMSFSPDDIEGMLTEYENDFHTGMNISKISQLIYDYTSGYPVLVSSICKINDENPDGKIRWTEEGVTESVGVILSSKRPLFESLINKLEDSESLRECVYSILINGRRVILNIYDKALDTAVMYGFVKNENGSVQISNRIFETLLYNYFLMSEQMMSKPIFQAGSYDKSQFTENGVLDMDRILEKFVVHFNEIMGNESEKFLEQHGREYFLLYLRPIINGTGNYYIEAETRDHRRMDVVVDYLGVQYIIELKIWRGEEYNRKGEEQLCDYLEKHNLKKGYLVSFCFNKNKESGVNVTQNGDKTIVEAVV